MSEWISVKDRLPDSYDRYWTWDGEDTRLLIYLDRGWVASFGGHECTITHWMPLPDPPTQQTKKEQGE